MKRDMDLARRILLAIESSVDDEPASIKLDFAGYDQLHLSQHVRLLHEAGLIHAIQTHGLNAVTAWIPHSLTWQGHDFLDAVRDEAVWQHVRGKEAMAAGDLPTQIIYTLALDALRRKLGLAMQTPAHAAPIGDPVAELRAGGSGIGPRS